MPPQVTKRPASAAKLMIGTVLNGDPVVSRLISTTASAIDDLQAKQAPSAIVVRDLAVGVNRINHGLGRRARLAHVTPTVADATFAWAFSVDNDSQAIITVVGVRQPGAIIKLE